jgi:hypothetical protein
LKKHQNCYVVGVSKQHFLCNENQHNKHWYITNRWKLRVAYLITFVYRNKAHKTVI